jgi:hypothetical protein
MYSKSPSDTEFHVFEGRGHSLTIDNGWKDVADVALNWLAAKGFKPGRRCVPKTGRAPSSHR